MKAATLKKSGQVRIDGVIDRRLTKLAEEEGRKKTYYANTALREYLDKHDAQKGIKDNDNKQ